MFAAVLKVTAMRVCLMPCVGPNALCNNQKYSGVQTTTNYWAVVLQELIEHVSLARVPLCVRSCPGSQHTKNSVN